MPYVASGDSMFDEKEHADFSKFINEIEPTLRKIEEKAHQEKMAKKAKMKKAEKKA